MLASIATLVVGMVWWAAPQGTAPLRPELAAEVGRLEGHDIRIANGDYEIIDVAGQGKPLVGCVRRSERGLELHAGGERFLLRGPLAVPRIAGPNYKVWVLGTSHSGILDATRLGIIAGPSACARAN